MEPVWTPERKLAALATCMKYVGTPHRNRMAVPGPAGGVDCIHFVAEVLTGAGIIPDHRLPGYDERLGTMRSHNVIEDILVRHLHAEVHTEPDWGDIVICKVGRQSNHVGIVIGENMWHVSSRSFVGYEALVNWLPRVQSFVRITQTGLRADPALLVAEELRIAPAPPLP